MPVLTLVSPAFNELSTGLTWLISAKIPVTYPELTTRALFLTWLVLTRLTLTRSWTLHKVFTSLACKRTFKISRRDRDPEAEQSEAEGTPDSTQDIDENAMQKNLKIISKRQGHKIRVKRGFWAPSYPGICEEKNRRIYFSVFLRSKDPVNCVKHN
jgi:hypothetical protein